MRLVKRMFAELVLNAARNDKSAHRRSARTKMSKRRLPAVRISTVHITGTWQGSLASTDDAGLAQPAYIVGIETEFRSEDSVAIFP
jgi:hypothetical protein